MIKQYLSWRKTEDVDLLLWQTPVYQGLAVQVPTHRCYAKSPRFRCIGTWADKTSFPVSFACWTANSIDWQESCRSLWATKLLHFFETPKCFAINFKDSYLFQGLKGWTICLFYANSLIIQFFFVSLQPKATRTGYVSAIQANLIALGLHRPCPQNHLIVMDYDILQSVSQGGDRAQDAENSRIAAIADELERLCAVYEA